MTEAISPKAPELSALQVAWLREIGIDKRMLARYAVGGGPFPVAPEHPAQSRSKPPDMAYKPSSGGGIAPVIPAASASDAVTAGHGLVRVSTVLSQRQPGPRQAPEAPEALEPPAAVPHDWEALQAHIAVCQACELSAGRSQTVFGTGALESPEWMVIGEAPGELDDKVGLPLQGRPGVLLQAMLASIGILPESTVFFTNLVKCRPLGNRPPKPAEIAACMPYLQRQITLLKPRRVLALGKLAAQALLGVEAELDELRGQVHHIRSEAGQDIPLVATYHPASLLMRPQHKADAWQDLNLARSVMGD